MFDRCLRLAPAVAVAMGLWTGVAFAEGLKPASDVKIAVVVHGSTSDPYWSIVKRGVDAAAAATGAQVQYIAPQVFDSVEHARLIEAAVATQPDGIVVSIPDADALKGAIKLALDAGIPVVNMDSGEVAGEEMGIQRYIGMPSEYLAGITAGEKLGAAGIASIACVNHEVGNVSLDERCQGIRDGLAKTGGTVEVVAVTPDPADVTRRVEAFLASKPDTAAIVATGPASADPLIKFFDERDMWGKYKLYSYDLSPAILEAVAAGKVGFGIDGQPYMIGYLPVLILVQNATLGLWPQTDTYTGPLFIDTPEKAKAVLQLAKEGTR